MDDNGFIASIRNNIVNSLEIALEQQQGIGVVLPPNIEIWTDRK